MTFCVLAHRRDPDRPRRAPQGTLVCRGCRADLERALIGEDRFHHGTRTHAPGLAELHTELATILATGQRSSGSYVTGTPTHPLPISPVIADHRRDIADILGAWVLQHMADWPETGPGSYDPQITVRWLNNRLDRAVTAEAWIGDYAGELRALRGRALALLDPVRTSRFPVAWCITTNCPELLVADIATNDDMLPALIYCRGCEAEWPPHRWLELGRAVRERQAELDAQRNGAA